MFDEKEKIENVFDINDFTIKTALNIKEKDELKRLKIIGWFASTFSFIGILLNAWKIIWCWPIWVIANIFWIYWSLKKKEWSQVFLWIIFTLVNLYGWFIWAK